MGYTLAEKIIKQHLVKGEMTPGGSVAIRFDNTLTQDSTGTMAYLQYEAITDEPVKTKFSVAYVDHNMLQTGPENMDDHIFIKTAADRIGVTYSRPGNGICHRLNLERFSRPGQTLIGSDSHTPTCGAVGMLAIGAGGLDVAAAMAGMEYYMTMPEIYEIRLLGRIRPEVNAKDVILEILRRLTVKGGVNRIMEYTGEGLRDLSVSQRAVIANMGAELGATTSIFPSDEATLRFLTAQGRPEDYIPLAADENCTYAKTIEINLSEIVPLAACPHSPDNVKPIKELAGIRVDQICLGSCTSSSPEDLITAAEILKGHTIAENVELTVSPGSRQALAMLADCGALKILLDAGARILECGCGPCIGMGQSPNTKGVTLRTFNRNFKERSGTADASVYLVSPEVAAVSAIYGVITSPEGHITKKTPEPESYGINDNMFIAPSRDTSKQSVKGPNIQPFPKAEGFKEAYSFTALTKLQDNITTDDIMPSNAKLLPYRSNIPYLSDYCLSPADSCFAAKAKEHSGDIAIIAGENYGQGSSREHAALVPLYLGVKAVLAKSFARIHKSNLINNGIFPLEFISQADYDALEAGDIIKTSKDLARQINEGVITLTDITRNYTFKMKLTANEREKQLLLSGGLINMIKEGRK